MASFKHRSGFAKEIAEYLEFKASCGYRAAGILSVLNLFDQFCLSRGITEPVFNRDDANAWLKRRKNEATTTHYRRVNTVKNFLAYLFCRGLRCICDPRHQI